MNHLPCKSGDNNILSKWLNLNQGNVHRTTVTIQNRNAIYRLKDIRNMET